MKNYKYNRESKVYKRYVEFFTFREGRKLDKADRKYCRKTFESFLENMKKLQKQCQQDGSELMTLIDFLEDDKKFERFKELGFSQQSMLNEIDSKFEDAELIYSEKIERETRIGTEDKNLKFVTYTYRPFKDEGWRYVSLFDQQKITNGIAKNNGYKVVASFQDSTSVKKLNDRRGFNAMLTMIRAGKANAIITLELNCLSPTEGDGKIMQQLYTEGKVKLLHTAIGRYFVEDNGMLSGHISPSPEYLTLIASGGGQNGKTAETDKL